MGQRVIIFTKLRNKSMMGALEEIDYEKTNSSNMNYDDIKDVIKHLKKVFPCTNCDKKFSNEGIRMLTGYQNEALFHFSCYHCLNQLVVHVTMVDHDCEPDCESTEKMELEIEAHNAPKISENDVLDIHNFLNRFDGDFKNLFQYK